MRIHCSRVDYYYAGKPMFALAENVPLVDVMTMDPQDTTNYGFLPSLFPNLLDQLNFWGSCSFSHYKLSKVLLCGR